VTYPLLQAMNLKVFQVIFFDIRTSYDNNSHILTTNFNVDEDTSVKSAIVKVVLFRTMYNDVAGQFVTYNGSNNFLYGMSITYDTDMIDYDSNYMHVLLGFRTLRFDLSHTIFFMGNNGTNHVDGQFR
jgi:hypothetical protein